MTGHPPRRTVTGAVDRAVDAVTPRSVAAAADETHRRISRFVMVTPLQPLVLPDGPSLLVKAEHLQHTGSFKIRGALAKLSLVTRAQRQAGVIAASSGNHGLGVAYALSVLGGHGVIYVPEHASSAKVDAIRRYGAEIRRGGDGLAAELAARADAETSGRVYISPYNDADVIAGQAGVGLEISGQLGRRRPGAVVVAVGGGGLISGVAAVLRRRFPGLRVIGACPANDAAMPAAVRAGRVVPAAASPTLSDGTAGGLEPDAITVGLCRDLVDDWVLVDEDDIARAMRDHLQSAHQLVEGASGVALAAAREVKADGPLVVVSCGANVSLDVLRSVLG